MEMPSVLIVWMVTALLNLPKFTELSFVYFVECWFISGVKKYKETITDGVEKTLLLLEKKQP